MRGAARSLLVTPWFAAGTGFVIAAGLWIYSPHAVLRFPDSAPATVPCLGRACSPVGGPGGGQLAVSTPGKKLKDQQRSRQRGQPDAPGGHPAAQSVTVDFTILWQQDGKFGALITVSGRRVPDDWTLSFELAGTQISSVIGASWQASPSGDGGTASAESGQHSDHRQDENAVNFMIAGSGSAGTPGSCVFDGASCSFS
jgi:hypothetical protein